jgi:hypothetical protein
MASVTNVLVYCLGGMPLQNQRSKVKSQSVHKECKYMLVETNCVWRGAKILLVISEIIFVILGGNTSYDIIILLEDLRFCANFVILRTGWCGECCTSNFLATRQTEGKVSGH